MYIIVPYISDETGPNFFDENILDSHVVASIEEARSIDVDKILKYHYDGMRVYHIVVGKQPTLVSLEPPVQKEYYVMRVEQYEYYPTTLLNWLRKQLSIDETIANEIVLGNEYLSLLPEEYELFSKELSNLGYGLKARK